MYEYYCFDFVHELIIVVFYKKKFFILRMIDRKIDKTFDRSINSDNRFENVESIENSRINSVAQKDMCLKCRIVFSKTLKRYFI